MVFCSWTSAVTFSLNYISHCSKRFRHSTYQHIFQVWPKNLLLPATAKWTDEMTRMISISTGIDGVRLAHHKYLRWSTHILTNTKTLHSQKIYLQIEHFFWSIDNFPIDRGISSAGVITWYKQKMADCKGGLTWATLAHEAGEELLLSVAGNFVLNRCVGYGRILQEAAFFKTLLYL